MVVFLLRADARRIGEDAKPSTPWTTRRMPNPAAALIAFSALLAAGLLVFWPRRGLWSRAGRLRRLSERVALEDVLKQLHALEYEGLPATLESIAGGVALSRGRVLRLLSALERKELAAPADDGAFLLTDSGREVARGIVRKHRLWERYLAERTGVGPGEWHAQADRREHLISQDEAEDLASALGHPVFDPHGDPIPTAAGDLPSPTGAPLTELPVGGVARVLHVEDEPEAAYARLRRAGLAPRVVLARRPAPPGSVRFSIGGSLGEVEGALARLVTVKPLSQDGAEAASQAEGTFGCLAELPVGEAASVVRISPLCRGQARRRLLDLGVVPGTVVRARLAGLGGDPIAYEIRGALIALRRAQTELIEVAPVTRPGAS